MEHMKLNSDNSKMGWPPSFSIASLGQQKTHGQLTAANEISSVYLYLFVCFLETIQISYLYPFALMYIYIYLYYINLYIYIYRFRWFCHSKLCSAHGQGRFVSHVFPKELGTYSSPKSLKSPNRQLSLVSCWYLLMFETSLVTESDPRSPVRRKHCCGSPNGELPRLVARRLVLPWWEVDTHEIPESSNI